MPIVIPSVELVGLLTDVISFALDDTDFPDLNCVRIAWDGELLHTQAYDGTHLGWSRWSPDDDPDTDAQESLTDPWGGTDEPWTVIISLADAKLLAKDYKVKKELFWTPLQIGEDCGNLRIHRDRALGLMAKTVTVDGQQRNFPDLAITVAGYDRVEPVRTIAFTAGLLAHFGDVRPRGPMEVTFTGQRGPAVVRIGARFTGAIQPVRQAAELKAVA